MYLATLITLVLFFTSSVGDLGFNLKFRNDSKGLKSNHYLGEIKRLKEFEQFTAIDLTKYQHSSSTIGKHSINKWTSTKSKIKEVIRVITVVPVDTVISERMLDGTISSTHHIKTSFEFTTYRFITISQAYSYLTIEGEGLTEYGIGNEIFNISYESIPLGLSEIYLRTKREIKGVLAQK